MFRLGQLAAVPSWIALMGMAAILLALALAIFLHGRGLWHNLHTQISGSRLLRRVVLTFSLVTILPTVLVSVFSVLFFNLGVEAWFNDRINTALGESLAVAEAYLDEHKENIRADALTLAEEIGRYGDLAFSNPTEFNRMVSTLSAQRRLTEVVVFQHNRIIAQGRLSFSIAFESLPINAIEQAGNGEVVILQGHNNEDRDRVRAIARVDRLPDTYLLVGRLVDDKVIAHLDKTQGAVNEYEGLLAQVSRLEWLFSGVFVALTFALLMSVVWYGLVFAARLTTPIARLAAAAERVRSGDYAGRVDAGEGHDEIAALARAFNRMMEQLEAQRHGLIAANRELDDRRRFSEAVLAGVSAGVIALDAEKRVRLANPSARAILSSGGEWEGRHVNEMLPGIQELLMQAEADNSGSAQGGLTLPHGQSALTLHTRVTLERGENGLLGYIVTFDDITPLVAAQRHAAWSDVARRVAHEIKNPLTPIALSAERLKRKYQKLLAPEEAETFGKYTDTIARHVADIGRMVEEFVAFARMPAAIMRDADLVQIVRKVLFSEQVAHPGVTYAFDGAGRNIPMLCDERQLAQALSNLLKNAAESIEAQRIDFGKIEINIEKQHDKVVMTIEDNGPGFPPDQLPRIMEAYVTTRARGSGLGLAIVKKIMEEHQGSVAVSNKPDGGARVTLSFLQHCDINAA